MIEFAVSEDGAKERQGRDISKRKGLLTAGGCGRRGCHPQPTDLIEMKGDRFDLPTLPLTPSTMAQRAFEINELARLVSCHLVSVSRSAAVSLARTCKMLEVPALSSLWELQDSLPVLADVLPATDRVRDPCHVLNSSYHSDGD